MEEPHKVIHVLNLQINRSQFLGSLSCRHQLNRVQSNNDLIIIQQKRHEQQQQQETIDPLQLVLGKVIGRGSYGVVYKGSYHGQTVAVKVLDFGKVTKATKECMKNDFMKEASLWKNLDHPNVTKMIGVTMSMKTNSGHKNGNKKSKTESDLCIVSEYVKGGSLRSYLWKNRDKKLPIKVVFQFALDIAKGLSYLHFKNIIHRDVKPENILIDGQNKKMKLADFGEAVFDPLGLLFTSGEVGTLGYMAPEVLSRKPYDRKCDVYSYGICLWEIYSCEMAYTYDLDNIPADIYKEMRPSIPMNCPRSLARLIQRCWDTDPVKRPEMKDVVVELEEIMNSEWWQSLSKDQNSHGCFKFLNHAR